jgi:hypothetical protein
MTHVTAESRCAISREGHRMQNTLTPPNRPARYLAFTMITGLTGTVTGGNLTMPIMAGSTALDPLPELTNDLFLRWPCCTAGGSDVNANSGPEDGAEVLKPATRLRKGLLT